MEAALKNCQKELKDEKAKLAELKEHFKYNLKLINDRDIELQRYDALFLGNMLSLVACFLLRNAYSQEKCSNLFLWNMGYVYSYRYEGEDNSSIFCLIQMC